MNAPLADVAKFAVGDRVITPTALGKDTLTGVVVEARLNAILQKWLYRIEVPDYMTIIRFERDVNSLAIPSALGVK